MQFETTFVKIKYSVIRIDTLATFLTIRSCDTAQRKGRLIFGMPGSMPVFVEHISTTKFLATFFIMLGLVTDLYGRQLSSALFAPTHPRMIPYRHKGHKVDSCNGFI